MLAVRLSAAALLALALAPACGQKNNRPDPLAFDCEAGGCYKPPNGGGGGSDAGPDASAGAAGSTSSDAGSSVNVTGTVVELVEDQFTTSMPYPNPATVKLQGPTGIDVVGNFDGVGFSLDAVALGQSVWSTVVPTGVVVLTTIQPVDTESSTVLSLGIVPAATIDHIYSFMTVPTTRTKGAAHVVLHFVDQSGNGVSKVAVTHQNEVVAYDSNGSWSDITGGTGSGGWAVVSNVVASSTPSKQVFQYTSGTTTNGVELLIASDAVTLAAVLVTP